MRLPAEMKALEDVCQLKYAEIQQVKENAARVAAQASAQAQPVTSAESKKMMVQLKSARAKSSAQQTKRKAIETMEARKGKRRAPFREDSAAPVPEGAEAAVGGGADGAEGGD